MLTGLCKAFYTQMTFKAFRPLDYFFHMIPETSDVSWNTVMGVSQRPVIRMNGKKRSFHIINKVHYCPLEQLFLNVIFASQVIASYSLIHCRA